MRGEVLTLRERDFVLAAQTMGSSRARLIYRHLIPNAMSVTIVNVTFLIADSIIYLALLGFLGFGLQFPNTSWGDMLGNAEQYVQNGQWWLVYPVGGCLVVVVLCCNLIGDALRDADRFKRAQQPQDRAAELKLRREPQPAAPFCTYCSGVAEHVAPRGVRELQPNPRAR